MTEQNTTHIPTQAIEDMRDVLEEDYGFVNAQHACEAVLLNRVASVFGSVENFLNRYGPY